MSAESEKVPNELPRDVIEKLRASNLRAISSSNEIIHLIKAYMAERNEQRKQWIMLDIMAKGEAKKN